MTRPAHGREWGKARTLRSPVTGAAPCVRSQVALLTESKGEAATEAVGAKLMGESVLRSDAPAPAMV